MGHEPPWSTFVEFLRGEATGAIELEVGEMENLFALLVLGSLVGLPTPPAPVSLDLLPHVEREVLVMVSRAGGLDDMLATLAGRLDIG